MRPKLQARLVKPWKERAGGDKDEEEKKKEEEEEEEEEEETLSLDNSMAAKSMRCFDCPT
jgi:hypothetical protein